DTFHEAAKAFAEDIASRSPVALSAAKHAIQVGSRMTLEDALLLEQQYFEKTMRSNDAAAAMEAYLGGSKTPYNWQGK
ncbi:MAG: enoyl-CoA hydratase/isomerase family protein, partial [Halieaceae bacterium]